MRVLVSTTSGAGHWMPLVPVARGLVEAGHELVVACPDTAEPGLTERGFEVRPFAEIDDRGEEQKALLAQAEETNDPMLAEQAIGLGFGYVSPMAALPRLEETIRAVRPHLVLRDPAEFASRVVAERDGIPSAVGVGGLTAVMDFFAGLVAEPVDRLRSELGLPVGSHPVSDALILTATPASFDVSVALPGEILRFGLGLPRVPAPPGAPTVYATVGTAVMHQGAMGTRLLEVIAEAFDGLDAQCVLTIGIDPDERVPPLPDNIDVRAFASHPEVIPSCRAVVSHGGAGTIQDAVHMGRPMVVLPQFADQFHNAERVQELGLGRALTGAEQTGADLRAAVDEALEGAFDAAVAAIEAEAASMSPVSALVPRLEALAS